MVAVSAASPPEYVKRDEKMRKNRSRESQGDDAEYAGNSMGSMRSGGWDTREEQRGGGVISSRFRPTNTQSTPLWPLRQWNYPTLYADHSLSTQARQVMSLLRQDCSHMWQHLKLSGCKLDTL
ncbi:hypothetical protein Tco_1329778 [Tanacetum coccineum]